MQHEIEEQEIQSGDHPVGKHLFKPASWLSKIDYVNHLVLFNNLLITVLAEKGAGKSSFVDLIREGVDSSIRAYFTRVRQPFSSIDFLAELDTTFHFRVDTEASFTNFVSQINERKTHVVIVIDDAHLLPDAFIEEALTQIKKQTENTYFHLCLVADFSLASTLSKYDASLIHIIEPGNLTESETKTYLLANLPSPKRLDKTMTDKRLEQFYTLTGGNVARINSQMISYFCAEDFTPGQASSGVFKKVLRYTSLAAMVALAGTYISKLEMLPSFVTAHKGEIKSVKKPVLTQATILPSSLPSIRGLQPKEVLVSVLPDINQSLLAQASDIPAWNYASVRQSIDSSTGRLARDEIEVQDPNVDALLKTLVAQAEKHEPVKKVVKQADLKKADSNNVKELFTVQILSGPKEDEIRRFIAAHHISKGFTIRKTTRNGHEWFVLTYGEFNKSDVAQNAVKQLPGELARYKPWVRSTSQLVAIG